MQIKWMSLLVILSLKFSFFFNVNNIFDNIGFHVLRAIGILLDLGNHLRGSCANEIKHNEYELLHFFFYSKIQTTIACNCATMLKILPVHILSTFHAWHLFSLLIWNAGGDAMLLKAGFEYFARKRKMFLILPVDGKIKTNYKKGGNI